MNIYQITPNLAYGDAVGNEVIALDELLRRSGYFTCIYAIVIDARISTDFVKPFTEMPKLYKDDIVILHLAVGSDINRWFQHIHCRKIIRYHNITPPRFFMGISASNYTACKNGLNEIKDLKRTPQYCLADSTFNKNDLISYGYQMSIDVVPILLRLDDYASDADMKVIEQYHDGITNILFTGRIAPNKKHENIIKAFNYYQKYYNPNSRLFLVGSYQGMEKYYEKLKNYIRALNVQNVIFTGHIKFSQILSYYHLADVFLCMSEHEGFCVPLVEAMYFGIPIVACDYGAVGETLGNGGFLLDKTDCLMAAGCINRFVTDEVLRDTIKIRQKEELKRFDPGTVGETFLRHIEEFTQKETN